MLARCPFWNGRAPGLLQDCEDSSGTREPWNTERDFGSLARGGNDLTPRALERGWVVAGQPKQSPKQDRGFEGP